MNIPCYYITIVLDRVNNAIVANPKIIKSIIVDELDNKYIVQSSLTNFHRLSIKKEWTFANESDAKRYIQKHQEEINSLCLDAKWWLENYKRKRNKDGNI